MNENKTPQSGGAIQRVAITDEQAIQRSLGNFLNFLRMNGIPTPSKAEARMLLYSQLYVDWKMQIQNQQQKLMENIQKDLPRVQQGLQMLDEKEKAAEAAKKAQEETKVDDPKEKN